MRKQTRIQCTQDVSGGKPVLLQGSDLPLWGMEVDPEEGRREFAAYSAANNTGQQVRLTNIVPAALAAATAASAAPLLTT